MFFKALIPLLVLAASTNAQTITCRTDFSPALAIPDLGEVTATVTCDQCVTISDIDFKFYIQHSYSDDLTISVWKDNGDQRYIRYTDETSCTPDSWIDVVIDETGTGGYIGTHCTNGDVTSPPSYAPADGFDLWDGTSSCGTWNIKFEDQLSGDTGNVQYVELQINGTSTGETSTTTSTTSSGTSSGTSTTTASTATTTEGEITPISCGGIYNQAIPDIGYVNVSIKCPRCVAVDDVVLVMSLDHTYSTDLVLDLLHEGASARIKNFEGTYATTNYINVTIDNQGTGGFLQNVQPASDRTVTSPPSYRPYQSFSTFRNLDTCGVWILQIQDTRNGDVGVLKSAELFILPQGTTTTPPFTGTTPGDVTLRFN